MPVFKKEEVKTILKKQQSFSTECLGHTISFEYIDPLLLVFAVNLYCCVLFNITVTAQILVEQDEFSNNSGFFSIMKYAFLTSRLLSAFSSFCELLTSLLLFDYSSGDI